MSEPELFDPNLPVGSFFKEDQKKIEKVEENQTVANFFETLGDTLKTGIEIGKPLVFPLEQPLKAISKSVSPLLPALEPQPSRYFETEGIKRKDIMITFANVCCDYHLELKD